VTQDTVNLKTAMARTVRELYRAGLFGPSSGNASVRVGEDAVLITPQGLFKGGLQARDLVLVDLSGRVREGNGVPSRETPLHLAVYHACPDTGAVIHSHPPMATALGLYDLPVRAVTLEALTFLELPVVEFFPPGSVELAQNVALALRGAPAALMRNHGAVTRGRDLRHAADLTHALEATCRSLVLVRMLGGEPATIPGPFETAARGGADP